MTTELTTFNCRFLAFSLVGGALLARGATARLALKSALSLDVNDLSDSIEVLDCGQEGRKIWLHNRGMGMPIFLSGARKRHVTVYRGAFYDDASWHGSRLPAVALDE